MNVLKGRVVVKGKGAGNALVTEMPINFTAAFTKISNLIPGCKSVIMDRHHELFRKNIKNRVLIFPACIGSTGTGMMLMQVIHDGGAPAAIIVQDADSLLVSGVVLSDVWFGMSFPVVEYHSPDIFKRIRTGDYVVVDGSNGEIRL